MVKKGYVIFIVLFTLFQFNNIFGKAYSTSIRENLKNSLTIVDNFKSAVLAHDLSIHNTIKVKELTKTPYIFNNPLNNGISESKNTLSLLQLKDKTEVYERHGDKYKRITANIWLIVIIAVILIIFGLIWVFLLRLQVRKNTESLLQKNKELQISEEKFRIITENASDIIWHLDRNFVVTYISPADERVRGFKTEEALGKSLFSILKPEGIAVLKAANEVRVANLSKGIVSPPAIYELEELCKDGSWVWIEATATAQYDQQGEISAYHGISRDISKRKKAEKLLQESDKQLRELLSTKEKLFSIIAHDLTSPFNTILGVSEILIENSKDFDAEQSEKYLGMINTSAQNTLVLLDNLLNWAKAQTGTITYHPEKTHLAAVVSEILEVAKSIAKSKNISFDYIEETDIEVYADVNMLKTILRNLVANAIKYSHANGQISISAARIHDHVEITVADNGVGMPAAIRDRLFEIETIVTTAGTANETGSGLGLILCKEFVDKHGGKIWAESEEGKGSSFIFSLPDLIKK